MLDTINHFTEQYHTATTGWYHYLFPIASKLFASLAVIELAWCGIWWAIEKNEVSSLFAEFLKKIVVIGFFYAILLHANAWLPAIINSFIAIGGGAAKMSHLYPGDIYQQGMALAGSIITSVPLIAVLNNGLSVMILAIVAALTVVVAFALIAAQMVVALIESYVIVSAGVLLLGFSAHQFTRHLALNYINYAIATGIKLFVLYMIVSVGANLAAEWQKMIITHAMDAPTTLFEVMGGALIYVYVVWVIPAKAQGLVTGQADFNQRDAMAGTFRTIKHLATSVLPRSSARAQYPSERSNSGATSVQQVLRQRSLTSTRTPVRPMSTTATSGKPQQRPHTPTRTSQGMSAQQRRVPAAVSNKRNKKNQ